MPWKIVWGREKAQFLRSDHFSAVKAGSLRFPQGWEKLTYPLRQNTLSKGHFKRQ